MTQLMQSHPGMVEEIISMLRHMEIDGETMQYIIQSVGLEDQMTRQLMFLADRGYVEDADVSSINTSYCAKFFNCIVFFVFAIQSRLES